MRSKGAWRPEFLNICVCLLTHVGLMLLCVLQQESEQRPHKVSFNVEKADAPPIVNALKNRLQQRGVRVLHGASAAILHWYQCFAYVTPSFHSPQLNAKLIYSGGYDLDVLPERAGKGQALAYLMRRLQEAGHPPKHVLACGDSGNDAELFEVQGANGVIVSQCTLTRADESFLHGVDLCSSHSGFQCHGRACAMGKTPIRQGPPLYGYTALCWWHHRGY